MTIESDSSRFSPLVGCLGYALLPYRPLDKFVLSLLGEDGPGGGDPGWWIVWIGDEVDAVEPAAWKRYMQSSRDSFGCFEAWLDDEPGVSGHSCGYYSREEVFACVREQLASFESYWPELADEARALSARFVWPQKAVKASRSRWSLMRSIRGI